MILTDDSDFWMDMLSSVAAESFCVIDAIANRVCYISPDDIFLCNRSAEDDKKSVDDFYKEIVYPDDWLLWEEMRAAIFSYLNDSGKEQNKIDYFSCTFRLQRKYSFTSHPLPQMVYYRMKPARTDKALRYLICSIKNSSAKKTGNLCIHNEYGQAYETYNLVSYRWKQIAIEPLTEREIAILALARQGKDAKEIAADLCKSFHTIRNLIKPIFSKLNVHSMTEAVEFADRYGMIDSIRELSLQFIENHHKRVRILHTDDIKKHIQLHLDDGNSIRQAAKLEGISESTILYWIKQGKLK